MKADLVIKNGHIVTPNGIMDNLGIAVSDGKVVQISRVANLPDAEEVLDAEDCYVLPGIVDAHTHIRDPFLTEREDFESGTKAAVAGGVTTILEMPNSIPAPLDKNSFETRVNRMSKRPYCDVGFYGAAGQNDEGIRELAAAGVVAFKSYMESVSPNRPDMEGFFIPDDAVLRHTVATVAETGLLHVIHLGNRFISDSMVKELKSRGETTAESYSKAFPKIVEIEPAQKLVLMAKELNARVHFAHITCKETADLAEASKREGTKVTIEVTLSHLHFTKRQAIELKGYGKYHPPIRDDADRLALWHHINKGNLDIVVSDFAPNRKVDIEPGNANIWDGPFGLGGIIEVFAPLMLTWVREGRLSVRTFVKVCCENPARLFGIYPKKGCATSVIGSDADFIIVDPKKEFTVSHEKFFSKSKDGCPQFDGFKSKATLVRTIVRGTTVFEDGQAGIQPPAGQIVYRNAVPTEGN